MKTNDNLNCGSSYCTSASSTPVRRITNNWVTKLTVENEAIVINSALYFIFPPLQYFNICKVTIELNRSLIKL